MKLQLIHRPTDYRLDVDLLDDHISLNQIANSGQCFRMNQIQENLYSIVAYNQYVEVEQNEDKIIFYCNYRDYMQIWKPYFDMSTDYEEIVSKDLGDSYLRMCMECANGIRILNQNIWECTISFIISQQKNIPNIKTCVERLCKTYGSEIVGWTKEGMKTKQYAFPSPTQLQKCTIKDFSDLGLGYRAEYIYDAVKWFCTKLSDINFDKLYTDYTYAINTLQVIKGVGPKVANCIALFGLHHLNACPIDVHMNRLVENQYKGIKPEWMTHEYAGIYQQYCFYHAINPK